MRIVKHPQAQFGQVDIADISFDARSRDDIPAILKGLQYIYVNADTRNKVFALLEDSLDSAAVKTVGRPGMELWKIFVLATVKLGLNCDFDRLQDLANNHKILRQMLGHSGWEDETHYPLQTLVDNVSRLKPEVLADINQVVVESGHALLKKKPSDALKGRCDSFVVETDVHYPTDTNLLWDAMRKLINEVGRACQTYNVSGWRQYKYNLKQIRKRFIRVQKARYSSSKNADKKAQREQEVHALYRDYLQLAQQMVDKSERTLAELATHHCLAQIIEIEHYIQHARRQVEQIERRVLKGEVIPHEEKVFSLFEEHTEWVSKGKAGVPVELGVRVCVLEDQHQFILHHRIMWKETDDKVAVAMVDAAQQRYPQLNQCSFDKGFYTPNNIKALNQRLDRTILPKKGRLNKADQAREQKTGFRQARSQHAAVESCINNLEQRGLDRCLSYGKSGFERHVALSIVSCNLHRVGLILQRKERERLKREARRRQRQLAAAA
jgi:hypothetical protein